MITREEAFAWLDKQVDAFKVMKEEPDDFLCNLTFFNSNGIHIYKMEKIVKLLGVTFVRCYGNKQNDKLYFSYRGVEFYGYADDKRIGKKTA